MCPEPAESHGRLKAHDMHYAVPKRTEIRISFAIFPTLLGTFPLRSVSLEPNSSALEVTQVLRDSLLNISRAFSPSPTYVSLVWQWSLSSEREEEAPLVLRVSTVTTHLCHLKWQTLRKNSFYVVILMQKSQARTILIQWLIQGIPLS